MYALQNPSVAAMPTTGRSPTVRSGTMRVPGACGLLVFFDDDRDPGVKHGFEGLVVKIRKTRRRTTRASRGR